MLHADHFAPAPWFADSMEESDTFLAIVLSEATESELTRLLFPQLAAAAMPSLHSEAKGGEKSNNRFIHCETASAGHHVSPASFSLKVTTCRIVESETSAAQVDPPLLPHILFHQAVEEKHKEPWHRRELTNLTNCFIQKNKIKTVLK